MPRILLQATSCSITTALIFSSVEPTIESTISGGTAANGSRTLLIGMHRQTVRGISSLTHLQITFFMPEQTGSCTISGGMYLDGDVTWLLHVSRLWEFTASSWTDLEGFTA